MSDVSNYVTGTAEKGVVALSVPTVAGQSIYVFAAFVCPSNATFSNFNPAISGDSGGLPFRSLYPGVPPQPNPANFLGYISWYVDNAAAGAHSLLVSNGYGVPMVVVVLVCDGLVAPSGQFFAGVVSNAAWTTPPIYERDTGFTPADAVGAGDPFPGPLSLMFFATAFTSTSASAPTFTGSSPFALVTSAGGAADSWLTLYVTWGQMTSNTLLVSNISVNPGDTVYAPFWDVFGVVPPVPPPGPPYPGQQCVAFYPPGFAPIPPPASPLAIPEGSALANLPGVYFDRCLQVWLNASGQVVPAPH